MSHCCLRLENQESGTRDLQQLVNNTQEDGSSQLGLWAAFSSKEPIKDPRTGSFLLRGSDPHPHHSLLEHFVLFLYSTCRVCTWIIISLFIFYYLSPSPRWGSPWGQGPHLWLSHLCLKTLHYNQHIVGVQYINEYCCWRYEWSIGGRSR